MKVDPIRSTEKILEISKNLQASPRDLAMFILGINTGLRAGDILNIQAIQIRNGLSMLDPREYGIAIREEKTKKERSVYFNQKTREVLRYLLSSKNFYDDEYIFQSRTGRKLTSALLGRMVRNWCSAVELHGNYASHSLRKTFGYHAYKNGASLELLQKIFNHSSPSITLRYIGLTDQDVIDLHNMIQLG